jgi:hypothetical protein
MNLNEDIVENHKQLFEWSCIPMAVELVLKLLGRMPADSFDLQTSWGNRHDGTFADFDGSTINGVQFKRQFSVDNGRGFPPEKLKQLFDTIDNELNSARYVIAALAVGGYYHNFVIYGPSLDGDYHATSKTTSGTWNRSAVKENVTQMAGTDILTYRMLNSGGA